MGSDFCGGYTGGRNWHEDSPSAGFALAIIEILIWTDNTEGSDMNQKHNGQGATSRGGARPGAGRPRIYENADSIREDLWQAVKRKAAEAGRTLADELVDLAYSDDKRTRLPAIRAIYQALITVEAPGTDHRWPRTDDGLPPQRPDPATVVPLNVPERPN